MKEAKVVKGNHKKNLPKDSFNYDGSSMMETKMMLVEQENFM